MEGTRRHEREKNKGETIKEGKTSSKRTRTQALKENNNNKKEEKNERKKKKKDKKETSFR